MKKNTQPLIKPRTPTVGMIYRNAVPLLSKKTKIQIPGSMKNKMGRIA